MDRREAILSITTVLGYSVTPASIVALSNACQSNDALASTWMPQFFSAEDAGLIERLGDTILPKTETPGATDVGAHLFVDKFLAEVASDVDQKKCREGLQIFKSDLKELAGTDQIEMLLVKYFEIDQDKRTAINELINNEAPDNPSNQKEYYLYSFLMTYKRLLMLGYYASEQIGENVLSYLPVPGGYKGCIPVEDVGNAWAL